jgi:GTP pyrophosphokinase
VDNRPGVLAEVAARIADTGSNIEQVAIDEGQDQAATLVFTLLVRDRRHLAGVIRDLRRMNVVKKLSRTCT